MTKKENITLARGACTTKLFTVPIMVALLLIILKKENIIILTRGAYAIKLFTVLIKFALF
jgi:hypothetical protein